MNQNSMSYEELINELITLQTQIDLLTARRNDLSQAFRISESKRLNPAKEKEDGGNT